MQADLRVPLILSVGKGSNFRFDHFREEVIKQPEAKFPVTDFRGEICYRGGARFPFDHFRMEVIKQPEAKISRSRFP